MKNLSKQQQDLSRLIDQFERVSIDEVIRKSPLAQRLIELFPSEKIEFVTSRPYPEVSGELSAGEFARSKRHLFLTEFRGQFFKRCPGAKPGLTCCNYFVLNWGQQCDMNCSYCYLQSFLNSPVLVIYSNLDQALDELRLLAKSMGHQSLRVGTGELVDSLSLDPLTLFSHQLIEFFQDHPQWTLEFKTKSDSVEQFLEQDHRGNVIVSWSINPQKVIEQEEHGTASLEKRLKAAELCLDKGFQVAFHMDPMIWHEDWRENYSALVDELTSRFRPESIPYLSLGALRFQPEQRHMMRERFGLKSWVNQAEMFTGKDGKLRYPLELRQEMFNFVLGRFKEHSPHWKVFLCMESPETWLATHQRAPQKIDSLAPLFDHKVTRSHRQSQELRAKERAT